MLSGFQAENLSMLLPQVVHGGRTIYNVRNGWDIARFLGDAVQEDLAGHLANLQCAFCSGGCDWVFFLPC